MGSKGFILLGLLFVLSVLCHSGYSLQCYRCLNPGGMCTNIFNCTPDSDACLSLFGGLRPFHVGARRPVPSPSVWNITVWSSAIISSNTFFLLMGWLYSLLPLQIILSWPFGGGTYLNCFLQIPSE
ncbi:hypothetical protein HJG60_011348 [Phyllostomus discolor]|uniref:Uncharacterized protein n=1 Tax=Phyllostomus discolor TaxID=89673 RepID=A0A834A7J3_9CHIR|nr:hypothetical protein HJG60_011348 [Phyllostomus discolor]